MQPNNINQILVRYLEEACSLPLLDKPEQWARKMVRGRSRSRAGMVSRFGPKSFIFDCSDGRWPVATVKHVSLRHLSTEFTWIMSGDSSLKYMHDHKCRFWDNWADGDDVGFIYGPAWRRWPTGSGTTDQMSNAIAGLRKDPASRRHIVCTWNVPVIADNPPPLPPCIPMLQFVTAPEDDNLVDLCVYQRSSDLFLGLPLDTAFLSLVLAYVCRRANLRPHQLHLSIGDLHFYDNHLAPAQKMLAAWHKAGGVAHPHPQLQVANVGLDHLKRVHTKAMTRVTKNRTDFGIFSVDNYQSLGLFAAEVNV